MRSNYLMYSAILMIKIIRSRTKWLINKINSFLSILHKNLINFYPIDKPIDKQRNPGLFPNSSLFVEPLLSFLWHSWADRGPLTKWAKASNFRFRFVSIPFACRHFLLLWLRDVDALGWGALAKVSSQMTSQMINSKLVILPQEVK